MLPRDEQSIAGGGGWMNSERCWGGLDEQFPVGVDEQDPVVLPLDEQDPDRSSRLGLDGQAPWRAG
jgi:hypothetical protein